MIPAVLYFLIYIASILLLLAAVVYVNSQGGKQYLCLSLACLGIASVSLLSASDKFDLVMFYFGLFNVFLGVVVVPIMRIRSVRRGFRRPNHR